MKVNKFTVNLYSDRTTSGSKETVVKNYNSSMGVFTNERKYIIYFLQNNQVEISEGEFRSSRDNFMGGFYLASNPVDYKQALTSLKKGVLPRGSVFGIFMENFTKDNYFKDNNFPMNLRPHGDEDYIISCLETNELPIQIIYYDDFVFEDGLHAYTSECLYGSIGISISEFTTMLQNSKFRIAFLWNELEIDKHWNCDDDNGINILSQKSQDEDKTFKEVIRGGFKRLKAVNSGISISKRIGEVKKEVESYKKTEAEKEVKTVKSNADYHERNKGEAFLHDDERTFTIAELKSRGEQHASVLLLNKLHKRVYKKVLNISFEEYVDHITLLLLKPKNNVDLDFAMRALKLIHDQTDKKHTSSLKMDSMNPEVAFNRISLDLGLGHDKLRCLLELPLRTLLQTINCVLTK